MFAYYFPNAEIASPLYTPTSPRLPTSFVSRLVFSLLSLLALYTGLAPNPYLISLTTYGLALFVIQNHTRNKAGWGRSFGALVVIAGALNVIFVPFMAMEDVGAFKNRGGLNEEYKHALRPFIFLQQIVLEFPGLLTGRHPFCLLQPLG